MSLFASDREILFDLAFFWPCHEACKILVPRPGIELVPLALEGKVPSMGHQGSLRAGYFLSIPVCPAVSVVPQKVLPNDV